jgi:hypothetical protein
VNREKRQATSCKPPSLLQGLEAVASRLAIPVRYERGEMRGGLCRLHGRLQIIINAALTEEEKSEILAESLGGTDLETVFVPPRVREWLEQVRHRRSRGGEESA